MDIKFKSIANIPMSNGKNIKELLRYKDISHWWFIDQLIYLELNGIYKLQSLASIYLFISKHFYPLLFIVDIITHVIYKLINIIFTQVCPLKGRDYLIIYNAPDNRFIKTIDKSSGKITIHNNYFDYILSVLSLRVSLMNVQTDLPTLEYIQTLIDVKKYYKYSCNPLMKYWSWNVWVEEKKSIKNFKAVYNVLINEKEWLLNISQLTGRCPDEILAIFERHLLCSLPFATRHCCLLENMIATDNPSLFILIAEHTSQGRGWVHIGKKHHIPTIALQHGLTLPDSPWYLMHEKDDMSNISVNSDTPFPLPDKTLVWGNYDCELLKNHAYYPEKSIVVVGNPKCDAYLSVSDLYSKANFCKQYGINPNNRLILWATQSHGQSMTENIEYAIEVFDAITYLDNITLLIKPHPLEGDNFTNIIKKQFICDTENILIMPKDSDILEQIYVSNLVIQKSSTMGQDVVILQKPMIVLDFSDKPDAGNYVKEGVADGVYKKGTLKNNILRLLMDDREQEIHRSTYIEKYMYKIDGLAAKRCADIITSFVVEEAK